MRDLVYRTVSLSTLEPTQTRWREDHTGTKTRAEDNKEEDTATGTDGPQGCCECKFNAFSPTKYVKKKCKKNVKNVKKCQKMSKNVKKCQKISKNVKKCQKMSKNVKKCQKM